MKIAAYKCPLAVYMDVSNNYDEFFHAYVKKIIKKIMSYLMDTDDSENISEVLKLGYVTKKNIDSVIEYAAEKGSEEIKKTLAEYHNAL